MLGKFLLIGVGGSGGKTLRYTWRELDRRLRAAGWEKGMPDAWQLLHVDVPERPDIVEGDVPADIGSAAAYVGLAQQPNDYKYYDRSVVQNPVALPAITGWRVDPTQDITPPYLGAGQKRAVGKIVAVSEVGRIGKAIDTATQRLAAPSVVPQLNEVNDALGYKKDGNQSSATVVVISSLAGGSGSGIFLDLIEMLKMRAAAPNQWLSTSLLTVLYASDTFMHLEAKDKPGVEANSAAALSEFLSAFEHEGEVASNETQLVAAGAGANAVTGRRSGSHNFIVGASNATLTFNHGLDVYRGVGKAFAAFMANDEVQRQFQTYIIPNKAAAPVVPSFNATTANAAGGRACWSLGYANVSLGRSLFAEYAEGRLAKVALDRLLRGHRENVVDAELRRDDVLVKERVEQAKHDFFKDSGLWELGSDNNQVLDALRSISEKKTRLNRFVSESLAEVKANKSKTTPAEWLKLFTTTVDARVREFEAEEARDRSERAQGADPTKGFVPDVQRSLLNATATAAGRYGLPVTVGLIDSLDNQLMEAARELEQERDKYQQDEKGFLSRAASVFHQLRDRQIDSTHAGFEAAIKDRREALRRRTEATLRDLAAKLLREVSDNVLPPLRGSLEKAERTLRRGEEDEYRTIVEQWSAYDVPPHLRAAPNELLLEAQETFPGQLDTLLAATFQGSGAGGGESEAVAEIIAQHWPSIYRDSQGKDQGLIVADMPWRASTPGARATSVPPSAANFVVDITPLSLLESASLWVRRRRGPVSDHVRGTLSEWLDGKHPDSASRATLFVDALAHALDCSAPLVTINPATHQAVHGVPVPSPKTIIGPIPISSKHKAYDRAVEVLKRAGFPDSQVSGRFNATSKVEQIEISSFLGHTVHPVVFDSLSVPILQDWRSRTTPSARQTFWSFRRARSLPSFVPLSPSRQQALVRGWLTAMALGYVDDLDRPWSERPLSVWSRQGRRAFPPQLLGRGREPIRHASVLPALLESMILAFVSFCSGQRSELEAYMRLIDLGLDPDLDPTLYDDLNGELAGWVLRGHTTSAEPGSEPAPTPPKDRAGNAADEPNGRRDAIVGWLTGEKTRLETQRDAFQLVESTTLSAPRGWEVADLMVRAYGDLILALERAPIDGLVEHDAFGD